MQKWGKRPIYFKNAEIMQNALIMQTLRPCTSRTNYKTGQSSAECYLLLKADLDWIVFQLHCSECW